MSITSWAEAKGSSQTEWKWGFVACLSMWAADNRIRLQTCGHCDSSLCCQNRKDATKLWTSNLCTKVAPQQESDNSELDSSPNFCISCFNSGQAHFPILARISHLFQSLSHMCMVKVFEKLHDSLWYILLSQKHDDLYSVALTKTCYDCTFTVLRLVSKLLPMQWLQEASMKCQAPPIKLRIQYVHSIWSSNRVCIYITIFHH